MFTMPGPDQPIPIVLDVDTGTDDALAILYAVAHQALDVRAITCVAGNSGLEHVVVNTCKVLDAAGAADIPVAAGASQPLLERARPEGAFHGVDGLGGIVLPPSARARSPLTAVELMRRTILDSNEPITLVALAPQTNLALLLSLHPDVADNLQRIVFMGGSATGGNVTAVAEFNVWQDPEAAACVIESTIPTSMYGLDVFNRLTVDQQTATRLRGQSHPAHRLTGELLYRRGSRSDGSASDYVGLIGDAGALVFLTDPHLFTAETWPTRVNLTGMGRGQTIVDRRALPQDALALGRDPWRRLEIALDLDVPGAAAAFVAAIDAIA